MADDVELPSGGSETNWTWIIRYPPDSPSCLLQWAENLKWFHLTLGSPSSPRIKIKSVQVSHSRKITGPLLTSLWSPWRYLMDLPVEPMPWFCAPRLSKRPGARHRLNDLLRDRCDRWRCRTRFPISGLLGPGHEPCSKVQARNQNALPLQGKLTWGWVKSYIILYYYHYYYHCYYHTGGFFTSINQLWLRVPSRFPRILTHCPRHVLHGVAPLASSIGHTELDPLDPAVRAAKAMQWDDLENSIRDTGDTGKGWKRWGSPNHQPHTVHYMLRHVICLCIHH